MRIGQSTDIHKFISKRPLILGGVNIPFHKGLLGHSDADVLVHVIMEAILGALALGDLGTHFPDTDTKYKNISSLILLKKVILLMQSQDYEIKNIDSLIILEKPHLNKYIPAMKSLLCPLLNCDQSALNIKATRGEGLGFVGRGEGIMAQAIVLLERRTS